jgi:hypothetical protein
VWEHHEQRSSGQFQLQAFLWECQRLSCGNSSQPTSQSIHQKPNDSSAMKPRTAAQ